MESVPSAPVEVETTSVEEIVSHLPGELSLPDGFSVSENFPEVAPSKVSDNKDIPSENFIMAETVDSRSNETTVGDGAPAYDNPEDEGKGEFYEGSDDEDEEELIIMAGDETLDGQEDWGEEGGPLLDPPLPGPPSGGPPGAAERTVPGAGGDDRGPPIKPGGPGSGPRIGYSGQGYYNAQPHHAQYKYVRPGSGASTGPDALKSGLSAGTSSPETDQCINSKTEMTEGDGNYSPEQEQGEKEMQVLSDFLMESTAAEFATKSSEKLRRFPVPLSGGEATPVVETDAGSQRGPLLFGTDPSSKVNTGNEESVEGNLVESATDSDGDDSDRPSSSQTSHLPMATLRRDPSTNDEPLQDMLELKIAELEVASTGSLKIDEEAAKRARATKRQVKEVKAMLDGSDRNSDEKLRLLNAKYLQQVSETKNLVKELSTLQRKLEQVNKEKDTIYGEYSKVSGLRQKLESLCRELQRQNKMLFDDSRRISNEEQMKRQELSTKFHNTIKDITSKLEEQGDERLQQIKENEMLRETLKALTQQCEKRDQHFNHQLRTKELEQQLAEVKLKQQEELVAQEEAKSRLYKEQIAHQLKVEQDLRAQLALYGDKFEQFQETLTKSNEVFATFKKEMEKMSKTIKKLEKENIALKKKAEKSDVTVIDLLDERVSLKKQLETSKNQKERLEALCRSMQAERKSAAAAVTLPSQASLQEAMSAVEPQAS